MGSADGSLTLVIQHMGKKELVTFQTSTTLREFQQKVEEMTKVPASVQKVVHRGRDLARNDPDITLDDCRVRHKDILMILGRPEDPVRDETLAAICDLETQAEAVVARLDAVCGDMDGMKKGFLPAALQSETRGRLERRLAAVSEELMRLLERLDALSVQQSAPEVRRKRKAVVTAISTQMDRADAVRAALAERGS
ncbi:BAG family molecular chaperone regulator 1-like [Pollicipes pollicipes]|uniref:BAG family molecular chaperone regulator 1-like n=1 Tax=Pollicipes pollicipes TaxID=41117 RepID=UPI0018858089|nr:BAG family molecular chaperone regulator 1-like [Pollicipes pollicipes]